MSKFEEVLEDSIHSDTVSEGGPSGLDDDVEEELSMALFFLDEIGGEGKDLLSSLVSLSAVDEMGFCSEGC